MDLLSFSDDDDDDPLLLLSTVLLMIHTLNFDQVPSVLSVTLAKNIDLKLGMSGEESEEWKGAKEALPLMLMFGGMKGEDSSPGGIESQETQTDVLFNICIWYTCIEWID